MALCIVRNVEMLVGHHSASDLVRQVASALVAAVQPLACEAEACGDLFLSAAGR